jgi:hypothetical protein
LSGEEKITARSKEMETLPIGKVRIEDLRTPETQEELLQNYPDLFEGLSQKYKSIITDFPGGVVDGWEDVIRLQEREYKSLPSEVYADDFATSIMLSTKFDPNRAA